MTTSSGNEQEAAIRMDAAISEAVAKGRQQLADELKNAVNALRGGARRGVDLNAEHDPAASHGHAGYARACENILGLIDDALNGNKLPQQWVPRSGPIKIDASFEAFFAAWVSESDEDQQQMAVQHALITVAEAFNDAIEASGKSRAELADRLCASPSAVDDLLRGCYGLNVRLMARAAYVLGKKLHIELREKG